MLRSADPDDLTLREARWLAQADRLDADADVPDAVLDRARRDAVRGGPARSRLDRHHPLRLTGRGKGTTMFESERIVRGMEVLDRAGGHVGIVEHHEGTGFRMSHRDAPDHHHHYIPHHWIVRVDDGVHINRCAEDVFDSWPGGQPARFAALTPARPRGPRRWPIWAAVGAGGLTLLVLLV